MIVLECLYNPVKDLKPVEPFGFVDLRDAFLNSCVPSQLPDSDSDYNGIDNPESILGVPSDVFDVLRLQSELSSSSLDGNDEAK